jgi:hypothetical protein
MEKKFDAVAWMRAQRTKIDEEDKGLSWDARSKKTHQLLETDPLWQRLRHRIISPEQAPKTYSSAVGEHKGCYGPEKTQDSEKVGRQK